MKVQIVGRLPMALPLWKRDDWCHAECYEKWTQLDSEFQALLGGHVHFDITTGYWRVPSDGCPPILIESV